MARNPEVSYECKPTLQIAGISVRGAVTSFSKKVSTVASIYLMGYFAVTPTWLVVPIIYYVIREERTKEKDMKRIVSKAAAMCREKGIKLATPENLLSWNLFPDAEPVEWINRIICKVWPNVNDYVTTLVKYRIEPAIRERLADYKLNSFQLERMILGTISPRIEGVKVDHKNVARNEILMDLDFFYGGDCDILFKVGGFHGGIKDFQMEGSIRVVMKPLTSMIPMIGGLEIFFLNDPIINFDLVGLGGVLNMPGIHDILRNIVLEKVGCFMMLPNKLHIMLSDEVPSIEPEIPDNP